MHQDPALLLAELFCPRWAAPGRYTSQRTWSELGGECTRKPRTYLGNDAGLMGRRLRSAFVLAVLCLIPSGGRLSGSFVGWWSFGFGGFSSLDFMLDVDEISTP